MNQEKIDEATRKAVKAPQKYTHSAMEATKKATEASSRLTRDLIDKSQKLRTPSAKAAKAGTTIGLCAGGVLLVSGAFQLMTGLPVWALGSLSAGATTIVSNLIVRRRNAE